MNTFLIIVYSIILIIDFLTINAQRKKILKLTHDNKLLSKLADDKEVQ